jgi:hypothetical protein
MTWWTQMQAWWRRSWQWVVAALGAVAALLALVAVRRQKHGPVADVDAPVPDPSPALKPLAEIGPQVDKIEAAERAGAAREAQEAQDAHEEIDSARSIADVNAVLYGVDRAGGGSPGAADGGAAPTARSDPASER